MAACPKCERENDAAARECAGCGVVFARYRPRDDAHARAAEALVASAPDLEAATVAATRDPHAPASATPPARDAVQESPVEARIDRAGWLAFGGGLAGALLARAFWMTHAALAAFATLVHEMCHAAVGWLYGIPSIPAFDFTYGGGVTLHRERSWLVLGSVLAGGAWCVHALRERPALRNAAGAALGLHALVALTPAHEAMVVAMGHGGELAFATLALHRALSGRGCTTPAERPLYGVVGWFLVLQGAQFAWQLRTSAFHREQYANAKGGGHWMDFSRLADEFLHTPLENVATAFGVLCLAVPLAALALQRPPRD